MCNASYAPSLSCIFFFVYHPYTIYFLVSGGRLQMKKYFLTIFAVCSGTLEMTLQCMCKDLEHPIIQQCCILYALVQYFTYKYFAEVFHLCLYV